MEFDLTKPLNWFFSDQEGECWSACHYAGINYRPCNPKGDVRINWELSRLQFLSAMAVTDEDLAKSILADWLTKKCLSSWSGLPGFDGSGLTLGLHLPGGLFV
jgi:hypothetical protein